MLMFIRESILGREYVEAMARLMKVKSSSKHRINGRLAVFLIESC
jgi:hypothetical protein